MLSLFGVLAITTKSAEAAAPQCYVQLEPENADSIFRSRTCNYADFQSTGFIMTGLPNPLENDKCYFWSYVTRRGQVVNCNEPRFRNAPDYSGATPPAPTEAAGPGPGAGASRLENPTRQTNCAGGNCINNNYLVIMAKWAINILSALVGVVVVAVIVFAGIEYSSSAGDPGRVAAARSRIINAVIALVAYMFLYVALQWLIPGGLFA